MASAKDPRPFLIVGGGIGGLGAALALARKGFRSVVLEQTTEFREVGAGIQMGPNVFRAFKALGLNDRVLTDAWQPGALEMRDALDGHRITRMPVNNEAFLARFGDPYAVTHRADLLQAILEACQTNEFITLETGAKVLAHETHAEGVAISLEGGRRLEGQALIGCDGLWSRIREDLVGDGKPRVSGHIAYRAVLKRSEVPDDLWGPDVVLWAGPKTHLVHYPLRRAELFNLVAVFHSDRYEEGWNAEGDVGELMSRFKGQRPEVMRLLDKIETWRMWVLCDREPVKVWSQGRVVLLGDAAHPMLQYLAQGACMALEDAVQLSREVAIRPSDLPAAFAAYSNARYLRTARVQLMARVYGDFYHARGPAAELRDMVLAPRTAEQAYDSSAWLYGGGVSAEG